MSEFLAEARILVRPDTTRFRAELEAALAAVTKTPIRVPVTPIVAGAGLAGATAQTAAFTTAQAGAAAQTQAVAAALETEAIAATQATAATTRLTASHAGLAKGAASSGLALLGVRGATLAASGAFLAGAAAVVSFSKAVSSAANLSKSLAVFRVTAGATADEMERIAEVSRSLGRDLTLPGVTAQGAADALTGLAKAGLSVRDAMEAARGTLQLATAAEISNAEAVDLVSSALGAFELSGSSAAAVADLLASAANQSQATITEMGIALSQAAAAANQSGVGLAETVSLLTILARAGLKGSDAGTSLRTAFIRLINPTEKARVEIEKLGVDIRDLEGNVRPEVFADFTDRLNKLSKAQRDATLAVIFGADAFRAAAVIGKAGLQGLRQTTAEVEKQGVAAEVAAARTEGLAGAAENLKNQAADLGIAIGKSVEVPATDFLNFLSDGVKNYATLIEAANKLTEEQEESKQSWAELAVEAGKFNRVLAEGNGRSDAFKARLSALNKGLVEQQSAGVKAASALEEYKVQAVLAAQASEGLNNRLDESVDRFKSVGAAAAAAAQPIGKEAKLTAALAVSAARGNLAEVERLQKERLAAARKAFAASTGDIKEREALFLKVAQAEADLISTQKQIAANIQSDRDAATAALEKAARDAATKEEARQANILAAQARARDARQNKISAAALTAGLADDVKQQNLFKALIAKQIAQIKTQITDQAARSKAITALRAIQLEIDAKFKQIADDRKRARQEQRASLIEGIQLDITFDQTTENKKKEIADRKKLISRLKFELSTVKAGTNAYKEIRNAIAEQNAALKDLQAEKQKGQSFAQASFAFLQSQQGFASNLLGNLIPSGATQGLVGGQNAVQGALNPTAAFSDGQSKTGPTSGQAQTTNGLLAGILAQLKQLNGDQAAPEAYRQRRGQASVMDGVIGG